MLHHLAKNGALFSSQIRLPPTFLPGRTQIAKNREAGLSRTARSVVTI